MLSNVKTVVLLVAISGLLLAIGFFVAGTAGLVLAGILAAVMNIGSYWFSDKLALAMTGAKEVTPDQEPRLHAIVDSVAAMANMPKPRVCIIQNDSPNAFATGRNQTHATVAATTGIMRILDERELTAVFGHELGHIRNRDILVNAIVATIASAISFLAWRTARAGRPPDALAAPWQGHFEFAGDEPRPLLGAYACYIFRGDRIVIWFW